MIFVLAFAFAYLLLSSAFPEPLTTVHIQNHDGPIYVTPSDLFDNQITTGNRSPTCGNHLPDCNNHGNQKPLLHNPRPTACDTDCKCVTKHLSSCVPINTVPQITCIPYYGYPDYSSFGYGYGYYPEGFASGEHVSEGLIPLLKSYLGNKYSRHGCQSD